MNFIFITPNEFKRSSRNFDDLSGFRMIPNNHIFKNWIHGIPEIYIDIMPRAYYFGDYINRVIVFVEPIIFDDMFPIDWIEATFLRGDS